MSFLWTLVYYYVVHYVLSANTFIIYYVLSDYYFFAYGLLQYPIVGWFVLVYGV
jgi:hypothetical protein